MSEISGFFKLNVNDFAKGLFAAVTGGAIFAVAGLVGQGFDVFTANWASIGQTALNAAFIAFVSYLGKNLFTTEDGKFLGVAKF